MIVLNETIWMVFQLHCFLFCHVECSANQVIQSTEKEREI